VPALVVDVVVASARSRLAPQAVHCSAIDQLPAHYVVDIVPRDSVVATVRGIAPPPAVGYAGVAHMRNLVMHDRRIRRPPYQHARAAVVLNRHVRDGAVCEGVPRRPQRGARLQRVLNATYPCPG
jgi:hypothetical protein